MNLSWEPTIRSRRSPTHDDAMLIFPAWAKDSAKLLLHTCPIGNENDALAETDGD